MKGGKYTAWNVKWMEREEHRTIANLLIYLSSTSFCYTVDSYRVTIELSHRYELRNGFLGRFRWVKPIYENML